MSEIQHAEAEMIPIARPIMGPEEFAAVQRVLESGELSQGRWVAEFENAFAAYCGARFAVATSSGTAALHLALLAHGIGPGDEVITTPFTFVASVNAILYVGARPVFADIQPDTFNIDPDQAEEQITPRTKAVLAVDLFGHPAELPRLEQLCRHHGLVLIEDACQAHGAEIDGRRTGSVDTVCFSFYPTKNMTTGGEGGLIAADDETVAETARRLRQHGATRPYIHDALGFNYRMTNLQAAIGLVQLTRLPGFNQRRAANAAYLNERLRGMHTPVTRPGVRHVFHQYTMRIPAGRDELSDALGSRGIESRVYYPLPVHRQPMYVKRGFGGLSLPQAESAAREVLSLPVHPGVSDQQLAHIAATLRALEHIAA
jgi:dTDP-4-amino-4,6-dideoxygalactose transaminase